MKRLFVAMSVLAAAPGCVDDGGPTVECGEGTALNAAGDACVAVGDAPPLVCGDGTLEQAGVCVPDVDRPRFEIRLLERQISADRLQPVPVRVFGTNPDGSPVTGPAVLSIDRPGAGAFPQPRVELDGLGAVTHYRPCSSTQPGCTGPVRLALSMLTDPTTPVATYDAELVERVGGSSAAACLGGGDMMFFDGEDDVYAGTLTVASAGWGVNGRADRLRLRVEPNDQAQGRFWRLDFSTEELGTPLTPGVYLNARRPGGQPGANPRPGLDVNGANYQCPQVEGRFEVHAYELVDGEVAHALISFVQRCAGAARSLRGCIQYDRE